MRFVERHLNKSVSLLSEKVGQYESNDIIYE